MSQKDIACFVACQEERLIPFDVQLIVQLFSPEMLDAELDAIFLPIFLHKKLEKSSNILEILLLVSQIPKKSDFYDTNGVLKYRECLEYSRFMIRTREKRS